MSYLAETKDLLVRHPVYGETVVKGVRNSYEAVVEAARRWKVQWSMVARDATFSRVEATEK